MFNRSLLRAHKTRRILLKKCKVTPGFAWIRSEHPGRTWAVLDLVYNVN
jgi:hypothetical protein